MTSDEDRRRVMVDTQVRPSDVTKFPVIEAMLRIPRERYVPDGARAAAYAGEDIDLGDGRVLLEPRTFAKMLDAANIRPGEVVLDVGCGLGYSAAVAAYLGEAVVALEEHPDLAREAEARLQAEGVDNTVVIEGKLARGAPEHGPYDVILIEGGVASLPDGFADQLAADGRIVCLFMEGPLGVARVGIKVEGALVWRFLFNAGAPVLPGFEAARAFSL